MKVYQVWDGCFPGRRSNRPETVRSDISISSLSQSPWNLGTHNPLINIDENHFLLY